MQSIPPLDFSLSHDLYEPKYSIQLDYIDDKTEKASSFFPQQNQTSVTQTINKRFKGGADLRLYHELNKQKSIYPSNASFNRSQHEQRLA